MYSFQLFKVFIYRAESKTIENIVKEDFKNFDLVELK